jgi:hypothetical protein
MLAAQVGFAAMTVLARHGAPNAAWQELAVFRFFGGLMVAALIASLRGVSVRQKDGSAAHPRGHAVGKGRFHTLAEQQGRTVEPRRVRLRCLLQAASAPWGEDPRRMAQDDVAKMHTKLRRSVVEPADDHSVVERGGVHLSGGTHTRPYLRVEAHRGPLPAPPRARGSQLRLSFGPAMKPSRLCAKKMRTRGVLMNPTGGEG